MEVPFTTAAEMMEFARRWRGPERAEQGGPPTDPGGADTAPPLWRLAAAYESARGDISEAEVLARVVEIIEILEDSLQEGLAGTEYDDRILGSQVGSFREAMDRAGLLGGGDSGGLLNTMILYVTAFMEVKSSMGVIVAAPTAGACGGLPGACLAAAHRRAGVRVGESLASAAEREEAARAMLAAGIIGVFIAAHSTFAAEVCGCQAETGAGAGMAAAALVQLAGGSADQALAAASMALQNTLGMICDPVANRVEVPCLGRNVLGASNALASANMALAGFDPVIPLDEVIQTMDAVGKSMPRSLRCTALGGLSVTPTSKRIEEGLKRGRPSPTGRAR
jgi:L-serine dehydratase